MVLQEWTEFVDVCKPPRQSVARCLLLQRVKELETPVLLLCTVLVACSGVADPCQGVVWGTCLSLLLNKVPGSGAGLTLGEHQHLCTF